LTAVSVSLLAASLLGVVGLAVAALHMAGNLAEQRARAERAEAALATTTATLTDTQKTRADDLARLKAVITDYQKRLADDEDKISKMESPDERRAALRALGTSLSLVPDAGADKGPGS
jgi:uncharacterized protein YlxW (UPF0749 family)